MPEPTNEEMNARIRAARGIVLPEPKSKRAAESQNARMNRLLRATRGITFDTTPHEKEDTDA